MPLPQHYYPSFEAIPPPMKMDMSRSPAPYETWPYGGNYGHMVPVGCHGCCNHSNFPGYWGYRPPYPYYPPPQQFPYHGGYPSSPETYPVHYVPPPNYSMGQPRYEYDKNVAGDHHCCGCPNHLCSRKEDKGVKIEEHEPELEKGTSGGKTTGNSLVPVDLKNQGYPIVWLPPEYLIKEQKNLIQPRLKGTDEYPHDTKSDEKLKPAEREPSVRNGWFPYDVNKLTSLNHGGDRTQNQPNEDMNQFPFPIFWMPYKPQEEEKGDHKGANSGQVSNEKSLPSLTPAAQFLGSDDSMSQPRASEEKIEGEGGSKPVEKKHATQKIIPVKQLVEQEKVKKGDEAKPQVVNVKEKEDSEEKKPSESDTKRQSSSPPKASKLPPVCLRVDPLPKRRNGSNGSSRSPSPPGHKGKSEDLVAKKEMNKKETKVDESVGGRTRKVSGEDCKFRSQPQVPVSHAIDSQKEILKSQSKEERKSGGVVEPKTETLKEQLGENKAKVEKPEEVKQVERKKLSEAEAAVVIQSAYRGFQVRRWEPLKKMKKIAEVREQAAEIRSRVEALESCRDISRDNKQRVVIGESIMSLLLKLDTIQGLLPSVRDCRKSVAKELVSLQEKLDSLTSETSEVPTSISVEDLQIDAHRDTSIQADQKEVQVGLGNIIGSSDQDNSPRSLDPCQVQVSPVEESTPNSDSVETSDLKLDEKEVCNEPQDNNMRAESVNKLEDGMTTEVLDDGQVTMSGTQIEDLEVKPPVEPLPSVTEEKVDSTDEVEVSSSSLGDHSAELPGMSDQALPIEEFQENEENLTEKSGFIQGSEAECFLDGEIGDANQVPQCVLDGEMQQPLLTVEQVVADVEDVGNGEVFEVHKDVEVDQADLVVQNQGEEDGRVVDRVEMNNGEDEVSVKESVPMEDPGLEVEERTVQSQGDGTNMDGTWDISKNGEDEVKENGLVEDTGLKVEEHTVQSHGDGNKMDGILDTSDKQEPQAEVLLAHKEMQDGEADKPEEARPEPLPSQSEIQGGERGEDIGMNSDGENPLEEKQVPLEVTEDYEQDSKVTNREQNQELVDGGREPEGLKSVNGSDEVTATQFTPGEAEGHEANGERLPMSPTALSQVSAVSEMGPQSDRKLLEENEKLREMMEKLIEAGREQITAISNLSSRVKDLEKKLARKKKMRTRRVRTGSSCGKLSNDELKGRVHGVAV
ncbi:hypothetical protein Vadar_018053 [Vaccinium darrowii]|uniref:Uncharacterized protein n=1 Tax=Vaccinium darrowii TaxID=229202 RepID=A0ACB7ZD15_9ERIC|nr:hypothetical protein Vadar_018053 [Vaccinium darrowii]